ncbi:Uncharacterised protein [Mycobacteroides abscessus subsp. abscessus]|nr:Uncharacterised protein [Mycobacteroides abscessus subsp. abscessus]
MEGLPVASLLMHQLNGGIDDVVDGNDVGASGPGQHHGCKAGQLGELGEDSKEVVRTVDLVHLTGPGIPDDDGGSVNPVPQTGFRTHQQFGLELGLVIGRRQVLIDVEVVFGELAFIASRDRDGRDVVQDGPGALGQCDHRASALDVGGALCLVVDRDVVDRGAVDDVIGSDRVALGG